MKLLIFVAFFVAVAMAIELKSVDEEWSDFKQKYNRNYKPEEEAERFEIFKGNHQKVKEHNERYETGEVSFTLGINDFSDKKPEEWKQRYGLGGLKKKNKPVAVERAN